MREWFSNPDLGLLLRRVLRIASLSKGGFTLIEVILVLAVGGLIFMLAFLAFSQVSANRRDAHRRTDARKMLALVIDYRADNNGVAPCTEATARCDSPAATSWTNFRAGYFNPSNFRTPEDNSYTLRAYTRTSGSQNLTSSFLNSTTYPPGTANYGLRATCENGQLIARATNPVSNIGIWMKLEKGSFCVDNS